MTAAPPTTLADWLSARLDEEYDIAYGAAPSPWREGGGWDGTFEGARTVLDRHGEVTARCYYGGTYGHVLRFDPTRVLAGIEAHRQIAKLHSGSHHCEDERTGGTGWVHDFEPCATLRLLALPYADAPGFRDEWRP